MTGFTKLWQEILTSSIWNEDDKVRIVWITLLAAMGPDGIVRASVGGLAHQARVSREDCEMALERLKSPDPDSRSKEYEGRRVKDVDGGFAILNAGKYREARNYDERKAYMAEYMKEYRRKHSVNKRKQKLNTVNQSKPQLAQAEAEAYTEEESTNNGFKIYSPQCRSALLLLNEITGSRFRETSANLDLIQSRLDEEGVDSDTVHKMIRRQCSLWMEDPKMRQYLRPQTLFNKTKFESYYANANLPINGKPYQPQPQSKTELQMLLEAQG